MATSEHRLEYEIRLKDLATRALKKFGGVAKKQANIAREAFKRLGKIVKGVGIALSVAFAASAFAGMRSGITRAREFSKAMGEVNTILGEGGMTIGEATEEVKALALALGVPAPEVAAGLYQTLSAGVTDAADAMVLLEGATRLGIAGIASTSEAVDLLTTKFNAYGETVTASGVKATSDMIFKTVQLGKTTIPELSASMGMVLPVASQLGVSFGEVAAAVAALTLKGLSTSEATTQLNAVFTAFLQKGELAKKTFGETTNLMGAQALKTKGLQVAITDLMNATGGSEDALLKLTGRAEGAKAIMSLTADGGRVLSVQLDEIGRAAGSADAAFAAMSETLDRKLSLAQEAVVQGFSDIAKAMADTALGGTSFDDATESAERLKDAISGLLPIFNGIAAGIGVIVSGLLALLAVQSAAWLGFKRLGNVMGVLSDEELKEAEDSTLGLADALVKATELTENFGRATLGLGPAARSSAKSLRDLLDADPKKEFTANIQEAGRLVKGIISDVEQGLRTEESALLQIKSALEGYGDLQRETGSELSAQQETWKRMIDSGTVFLGKIKESKDEMGALGEAARRAANDVSAALGAPPADLPLMSGGSAVSDARIQADEEFLARALENEAILDMARADGFEKDKARIVARSAFDKERFRMAKEQAALLLRSRLEDADMEKGLIDERVTAFSAASGRQVARFNESRDKMEARELAALQKTTEVTERETRKAEAVRLRAINENAALIAAAIQGPIVLGMHLAASAAAEIAETMAANIKGKVGPALAEGLGGALEAISGEFTITPQMELEALTSDIEAAREQLEAALSGGLITRAQGADMEAMIENVEKYGLAAKGAAEGTDQWNKEQDKLKASLLGVKGGIKNFTDKIPELGEAIADVTEGALRSFASGLTSAMMAFADGTKTAKEAFKDFAREFIAQVAAMIVQMLILQAIKVAFGIKTEGMADGGVVPGGVGDATPLATGGIVSGGLGRALPVRGYAMGGPIVSSPHVALIGEGSMNEAVVPLPDGRSIPVDMRGGSGTNISFSINAVDARGIDELLVERQDTIRNLIRQAMVEDRVFRRTFQGA